MHKTVSYTRALMGAVTGLHQGLDAVIDEFWQAGQHINPVGIGRVEWNPVPPSA
jgi:hypothetical protein